jgi:hypothetical protein
MPVRGALKDKRQIAGSLAAFADSSDKVINAFIFRPEVRLKRIEVGHGQHTLLVCEPFQFFSRRLCGGNVVVCYRVSLCHLQASFRPSLSRIFAGKVSIDTIIVG